jgi:hypothetical protein
MVFRDAACYARRRNLGKRSTRLARVALDRWRQCPCGKCRFFGKEGFPRISLLPCGSGCAGRRKDRPRTVERRTPLPPDALLAMLTSTLAIKGEMAVRRARARMHVDPLAGSIRLEGNAAAAHLARMSRPSGVTDCTSANR